jgi:cobalt/nickel transport system ATP-binding protein
LLFQDTDDQLFCPTVLEDVAFGPLNLGKTANEARDLAAATLHQVGLDGYEERVIHKLSGGEKRLVALAGVLAMSPDVVLLDEPCAGLDEAAEKRITEILLGLPHAMIVVSHHRGFLDAVVHETLRLQDGSFQPINTL